MRYKHFKTADVDVSSLAVGTWAMGGGNYGPVDRTESIRAIHTMLERGVNLIDTAPCYGNGASEKIVGEALQGIDRDKVLISTKFGLATSITNRGYVRDSSYRNVMREVQSSLMNLKTDYIDFYFVHWPDVNTPIYETMSALADLKRMGYIRYVGVSNFSREQIEEAEKYLKLDVQQPLFSMVDQKYAGLMRWGMDRGIDTLTYGSMGGGVLTGMYRSIPNFDKKDTRLNFYDTFREPKFSKIMELMGVMDEIAEAHNSPVGHVALNWSTQKDFVGTALVGVRDAGQALENCAAFDWKLTAEEMERLDRKLEELELVEEES